MWPVQGCASSYAGLQLDDNCRPARIIGALTGAPGGSGDEVRLRHVPFDRVEGVREPVRHGGCPRTGQNIMLKPTLPMNVSKFRIMLAGIDNRRHDRRPSCGGQKLGEAGQESRHITFETARIRDLLVCAYARASVQDKSGSCGPVSINGGLGDPGSARNLIDTDAAQSALGQEFESSPKHDLFRATHTIIERLRAAAVRGL